MFIHRSFQFSHSVVSDSLRPHGLQHARLPCPSPTSRVYSNSCPLSRWCHPISSSVIPFSSRLQSLPASVQFSSVAQSCSTLCDPMNCSMPGLPVHHQLLEFTQTHVHWIGDPSNHLISVVPFSSHLQSFPASGSFQMSQFFTSGGQSTEVSASASVLPMNIQDWSPLGWTGWISF